MEENITKIRNKLQIHLEKPSPVHPSHIHLFTIYKSHQFKSLEVSVVQTIITKIERAIDNFSKPSVHLSKQVIEKYYSR